MGASDADEEGTWRWVTGPEGTEKDGSGRHFFTQTGAASNSENLESGGDILGAGRTCRRSLGSRGQGSDNP